MTVRLGCGPADLVRFRFGFSPLWETGHAVRLLLHPASSSPHTAWRRWAQEPAAALDLSGLRALNPDHGYTPDFFTPPPTGPGTEIEDELARVRATPPEQVRAEIDQALRSQRPEPAAPSWLRGDPARARDRLAETLADCWQALLAPTWPTLREVLEADIAHHTRRLSRGGAHALFESLDPRVSWSDTDSVIRVDTDVAIERDLGGAGLVLMPSAFVWPRVAIVTDPPWQPTLIYPARGIDALWRERRLNRSAALSQLLGARRAAILTGLATPSTTSRLARALRMSPAAVSEHLAVLLATGLVSRRRTGREVEYVRTALGDALVTGGAAAPAVRPARAAGGRAR